MMLFMTVTQFYVVFVDSFFFVINCLNYYINKMEYVNKSRNKNFENSKTEP